MAPDAFLKAQRAGELAQPTRWMKGRQSFCIRRDASDALRIVRTCRTDSEDRARLELFKLPLLN
jgi:hypothetical protein